MELGRRQLVERKAALREEIAPVRQRLLIEMSFSALAWLRRRHDYARRARERRDEIACVARMNVFSNLVTPHQRERATDEGLIEIVAFNALWVLRARDGECGTLDAPGVPAAVDEVVEAPAYATADIQHPAGLDVAGNPV